MLGVVGVLLVGGGLAASEEVATILATREVRAVSQSVRQLPLPAGFEEWTAACGMFGLRCAQTTQSPAQAVEALAAELRGLGLELEPVRCGEGARVDPGTSLAGVVRHERQCTATAPEREPALTVAAWDVVPPGPFSAGAAFELGLTALVVEWDSVGTDELLRAEPRLAEERFADDRLTKAEIMALPGAFALAECAGEDADGCVGWEVELEGPGERRDLLEAWGRELLGAGFLVMNFECERDRPEAGCTLYAEAGREGVSSRTGLRIDLSPETPETGRALIFTA